MAMAEIGAIAEGGVNRQALSAEDIRARALLLEWAGARGWQAAVDPIANLFVRRPGRDPAAAPVVVGSHMDSQPAGGRFDGIFGVLAALEAMEALEAVGIATGHPIDLVAWTNEEGGRFAPGAMGSAAFAGAIDLASCLKVTDAADSTLAEALEALDDAGSATVRPIDLVRLDQRGGRPLRPHCRGGQPWPKSAPRRLASFD